MFNEIPTLGYTTLLNTDAGLNGSASVVFNDNDTFSGKYLAGLQFLYIFAV